MKNTASEPGLNLLFHWSPLICTSILFRDRDIVMSQSLLFSQPVTSNLSNRCILPQQYKGFDYYLGKRDSAKFGLEMWIGKENDFWDSDDKSSECQLECGFLQRKEWECVVEGPTFQTLLNNTYIGKHQINKIGIITFKFDCPG